MGTVGPIVPGLPGVRTVKTATPRRIFHQVNLMSGLAPGKTIDGSESRDPGNTGDEDRLRPGLLMGRITASGLWAPAIVGVTTAVYTDNDTSLTVSAATATELFRLVGSSGTAELIIVGPPTSAGTVATAAITHSAINTSTGVLTISDLNADFIAGSLVGVNDGRYVPRSFIPNGYPVIVTDSDGSTSIDEQFPDVPIAGVIDVSQFLPAWPSDTSLRAWIKAQLNAVGQYVFDDDF